MKMKSGRLKKTIKPRPASSTCRVERNAGEKKPLPRRNAEKISISGWSAAGQFMPAAPGSGPWTVARCLQPPALCLLVVFHGDPPFDALSLTPQGCERRGYKNAAKYALVPHYFERRQLSLLLLTHRLRERRSYNDVLTSAPGAGVLRCDGVPAGSARPWG